MDVTGGLGCHRRTREGFRAGCQQEYRSSPQKTAKRVVRNIGTSCAPLFDLFIRKGQVTRPGRGSVFLNRSPLAPLERVCRFLASLATTTVLDLVGGAASPAAFIPTLSLNESRRRGVESSKRATLQLKIRLKRVADRLPESLLAFIASAPFSDQYLFNSVFLSGHSAFFAESALRRSTRFAYRNRCLLMCRQTFHEQVDRRPPSDVVDTRANLGGRGGDRYPFGGRSIVVGLRGGAMGG